MRDALREFVGRGDKSFKDEVTTWLGPSKRRKPTKHRPLMNLRAREFFESCGEETGKTPREEWSADLVKGLESLQDACKLSATDYGAKWRQYQRNAATYQPRGANRQKRIIERQDQAESMSWVIESQRRLGLLHLEYEVKRLPPQPISAERAFSNLAGIGEQELSNTRRNVRPYLHLSKRENGLGLLLLLGVQTRKQ